MIYAMHKPIQQLWNKITARLFAPNLLTHIANLYGGLLVTIFIIFLIIIILRKWFPLAYSILSGKRMYFTPTKIERK